MPRVSLRFLATFRMLTAWQGTPRFEVKWEGWDKKADRTFEPEENLT